MREVRLGALLVVLDGARGHPSLADILAAGHSAPDLVLDPAPQDLGRLRASPQSVEGIPVVPTYAPSYLLRAPQAKAAAWADLCRALAVVRKAADT